MDPGQETAGQMLLGGEPDWRPIERVLPAELLETFMWMFEVETVAGHRIHAYKHIETRRYLHLDAGGDAFYFAEPDRYRRIELAIVLEAVFSPLWEGLNAAPEHVAAAWTAIERAWG